MDSQEINNRINDLYLKISEIAWMNPSLSKILHEMGGVDIDLLNKIDELERRLDERTN